ncbi:hypothetical protein [Flavobacterium sp. N1736]|uniref:hypothetical protein n=1 Tax=Flavobacterium sp. N1736 TaxID=2986823 RepID=UPI00222410E1|nr:hypothetical protein [Flavobacterium sp. N1736]
MDLENLDLIELNSQELQEINGGIWWPVIWFAAETVNNITDSYNSFKEGYNASNR